MKKPDPIFSFVVARPWEEDKPNNLRTYSYAGQVQTGTMKSAKWFLKYVRSQCDTAKEAKAYKIYRVDFTPIK